MSAGGAEVTGNVIESHDFGYVVGLGDGRTLMVNVTVEGIIMDVYSPRREGHALNVYHDHLGTVGMTFDEWADRIAAGGGSPV